MQCKEAQAVFQDPDFRLEFTTSNGQTVRLSNGSFCTAIDNNPELAKFVIIGSAVGGVLLVLSGLALKAMGAIGNLAFMVKNFAGAFGGLGGALKTGAVKIVGAPKVGECRRPL